MRTEYNPTPFWVGRESCHARQISECHNRKNRANAKDFDCDIRSRFGATAKVDMTGTPKQFRHQPCGDTPEHHRPNHHSVGSRCLVTRMNGKDASEDSKATIGYFTVVDDERNGWTGGLLVLDNAGRPIEFQCTLPVRPTRTHEILFGPTLKDHVIGRSHRQGVAQADAGLPSPSCVWISPKHSGWNPSPICPLRWSARQPKVR